MGKAAIQETALRTKCLSFYCGPCKLLIRRQAPPPLIAPSLLIKLPHPGSDSAHTLMAAAPPPQLRATVTRSLDGGDISLHYLQDP